MWKKADGGLWNCNGVEGKEEDVEAAMVQNNLTFLVLVEPKETVLSFSARLDEEQKEALGWAVVGKGRKTGERGGGVWIVVKDEETEMQEIESEEQGDELAEVAAAFVRPRGAQEWTAVIGVGFT